MANAHNNNPVTRRTAPGVIVSLLNDAVKPIFLLGAGASKQSGIRLVTEIVDEIAKWAYCRENALSLEDPRLTMSDWKKWLQTFDWYIEDYSALYPIIVEKLLHPRQTRKDFFLRITHPDIPASKGYEIIAELMHLTLLDTVLTTNFDDCLQNAKTQLRKPPYIQHIKTPSDLSTFSYTPRYPQQVYLHGSVEHYTDQNLENEVQNLNLDLISTIKPFLKDRPLVVIGYRGAEPSVMNDLFLKNLSYTSNFHQGIYWCMLKKDFERFCNDINSVPELFLELFNKTGANFHIIPIDGFDELMVNDVWGKLKANEIDLKNITVHPATEAASPILDAQIIGKDTIGALEIALIRERITNYCARLGIKIYQEDDWLYQQMQRLKLGESINGKHELTSSGILLFSSKTQQYLPHAQVLLKFVGSNEWIEKITAAGGFTENADTEAPGTVERKIEGNLWTQLNQITEALTLVNKPFRLKDEVSDYAYPYPTLALKEIIVNSLVHRDYTIKEPVTIEVHENFIVFTSPGGLVEEVRRQIQSSGLEQEIRKGRRGIKGYRNPVIADLFYGAGAMDKEGSGLSDVLAQANLNSSSVTFDATADGKHFEVRIYRRIEEVDEVTSTATPIKVNEISRFACNLFEFLNIPEVIYHGETSARSKHEIRKLTGNSWTPPYSLHKERLWSFYDFSARNNPLWGCVEAGTIETISVEEFIGINGGTNELVRMLNECLIEHLFSIGLRVDIKKHRAYFTKTMEGNAKEITYQGRFKKATRTVAKPRENQVTGKVYYWEHKSIWFSINNIGGTWYLCLNPSYVFTTDGVKSLLKSERVNVLSTRRASRDYNQHVLNDLTFWASYISSAQNDAFILKPNLKGENAQLYEQLEVPEIVVSSKLPSISVSQVSLTDEFEPTEIFDMDEIEQELEELAKEEQENIGNIDGNTN